MSCLIFGGNSVSLLLFKYNFFSNGSFIKFEGMVCIFIIIMFWVICKESLVDILVMSNLNFVKFDLS